MVGLEKKNQRMTYHFGEIHAKCMRVKRQNRLEQGTAIEGNPNQENHGIERSAMISLTTESWADGDGRRARVEGVEYRIEVGRVLGHVI